MGKQNFVYLFWLSTLLALFACKDDDITVEPFGPSNGVGSCSEDMGIFELLESSLTFMPYEAGNSEVIFQNEVGQQESFSIAEKSIRDVEGIFYDYNVYEDGDTISYCYAVERKMFVLTCLELDLEFEINIEVKPYFPALNEGLVADIVNIFYTNNQISPSLYTMVFRKNLDNRSYPSQLYTNNVMKTDQEFIGSDFENVEHTAFNNPSLKLFFTKKEGIVAFENDLFGLWRFVEIR